MPVPDVHVQQPGAELVQSGPAPSGRSQSRTCSGVPEQCLETYLWIVARVQFFGDRGDVLSEELQPLLLEADLVHVDIHGGDILIASGQTLVLDTNTQEALQDQSLGSASLSHKDTHRSPCGILLTIPHGVPWSPPDGHTSSQRRLETNKHLGRAAGDIRSVLDYRWTKLCHRSPHCFLLFSGNTFCR